MRKRLSADEVRRICKLLPECAPEKLRNYIYQEALDFLGGEFVTFKRASVYPGYDSTFYEYRDKPHWGAECRCSCCDNEFTAGWFSTECGRTKGIRIIQGEDGELYPGYVPADYDDYDVANIRAGDCFPCPICGNYVNLIHKSSLANGRIFQHLTATVELVGEYTALVYWLARRQIYDTGYSSFDVRPRSAAVIGTDGRI